ncbi:MAG: hypothetical protein AAF639_13480 [Chloroflexota bacterium]
MTPIEDVSIQLFQNSMHRTDQLCISPSTAAILNQLAQQPLYARFIALFFQEVAVISPTRYCKRWASRLRHHNFSGEDATILALSTFASLGGIVTSMDYVVTFDKNMINRWQTQHSIIQTRFDAIHNDWASSYRMAKLPQVVSLLGD